MYKGFKMHFLRSDYELSDTQFHEESAAAVETFSFVSSSVNSEQPCMYKYVCLYAKKESLLQAGSNF